MIDFSTINIDQIESNLNDQLRLSKERIESLSKSHASAFDDIMIPLERSTLELDQWKSILYNLHAANTSPELEALLEKMSPKLSAFGDWMIAYTPLFEKIDALAHSDQSQWTTEQRNLVKQTHQYFTLNGTQLDTAKKELLTEVNTKLSLLSLDFAKKILADQNAFVFHTTDLNDLSGAPQSMLEQWEEAAKKQGKAGYLLKLDMPTYMTILKNGSNRSTRELFYRAFNSRGNQANENNTHQTIQDIAKLRQQKAEILGFESYAEYTLKSRMAENPTKVLRFLDDLETRVRPLALEQKEELTHFVQDKQAEPLQRWDIPYWSDKLKQQTIELDENKVKEFFSLDQCIQGIFSVAEKLFDLSFELQPDFIAYHSDVKTYKVYKNKELLSYFMMDIHPRESKRNGAWMTSYQDSHKLSGSRQIPIVSIVCNFSKPTSNTPSLLLWDEVLTLFHEFGHALHGMLAQSTYPSISGTHVYWDFVELPSQIMENWCFEKECLDLFAKHYKTGESIPTEMVHKLQKTAQFQEGIACMRQLSLGKLDMAWHHNYTNIDHVEHFENQTLASLDLFEPCEGTNISSAFSHIFQGGYAAGYYSYKWAEVLDAQAFEVFKQQGIFNKTIARQFEDQILSKGGEEHPQVLFEAFTGQTPSNQALLKRIGL